jgi:uncharacterized membrane protein YczE
MNNYEIKTDNFIIRLIYFFISLAGIAVGVAFIFLANIGTDPINVFVQGLSISFGFSVGTWITALWIFFVLSSFLMGVKPYIATILDLILFGFFVDLAIKIIQLPKPESLTISIIYLSIGLFLYSMFFGVYLNTKLGAGPIMLFVFALSQKTKKSIGFTKTVIDSCILLAGFLLGGIVGLGTIFLALSIGYSIEFFTKKLSIKVLA